MSYSDTWILRDNDLNNLLEALKGNKIVTRMAASQRAAGANMSVDIQSGDCIADETYYTYATTTNVTIDTADATHPRKDLICVNTSGTIVSSAADANCKGTPAAASPVGQTGPLTTSPAPPNIPSGYLLLAEVWVPANATTIVDAYITDRRILAPQKFPWNMGPLRDYSRFISGTVMMKAGYLTCRYAKYQRIETAFGVGGGKTFTRQSTITDLLRRGYGTYQFKYYLSGWESGKQYCVGFFWGGSCTYGGAYFYLDRSQDEKVNTSWNTSVTNTAITWDPTTEATLKIEWTASQVKFYVDGGLQATHTTNVPQEELPLGWEVEVDFKDTDYSTDAWWYFKDWERLA